MTPELYASRIIISDLYKGILGREPDPAGLDQWSKHLAGKVTDPDAISTVCVELIGSAEFKSRLKTLNVFGVIEQFAEELLGVLQTQLGATPVASKQVVQDACNMLAKKQTRNHPVSEIRLVLMSLKGARMTGELSEGILRGVNDVLGRHQVALKGIGVTDFKL